MTYQQVVNDIKRESIQPVYVVYGTEYYFINEVKEQLEKKIATNEEDIILYDLKEVPLQDVIIDAETFPFFNEKKLIIAHNPVFLQAKPDKISIEHDLTFLERYLNNPAEYSTLVFIAPYEKLDARKKITKLLKKSTVMVECNPAKGQALTRIIEQLAQENDIHLTTDAIALLESEFQDNVYMLQKEIEKLASYVGADATVSKEIVEKVISPSNTFNALQFVDAVLKKDLSQAVKIYKELEKMKEEPIGLIALLAYQFRVIFQVKLLQEKGYSLERMKSELKVHPYVVQLAKERSKYFSRRSLTLFIHYLVEADENIKRGKMEKGIAFEMLLYKLIAIPI